MRKPLWMPCVDRVGLRIAFDIVLRMQETDPATGFLQSMNGGKPTPGWITSSVGWETVVLQPDRPILRYHGVSQDDLSSTATGLRQRRRGDVACGAEVRASDEGGLRGFYSQVYGLLKTKVDRLIR